MCLRIWTAAALALAFAAGQPGAAGAETLTTVTIGVAPVVPIASTYLAVEKGWLREAGIDLQFQTLDSVSKFVPFLASNRVQLVQGGVSAGLFNAIGQGLPITLALDSGSSPINSGLLLRPDLVGTIRTIADLKGRSVAVVAPGATPVYGLGKTLETAGLTLKDVAISYVPFTQMGAAFANNAIDAALEVPPFGDYLVDRHIAARWLDPDDFVRPTPEEVVVLMINTDWAKANHDVAHRLVLALARGGREYCQAYHHGPNRAELAQTLIDNKVMTDLGVVESMGWQARDPNGRLNTASLLDEQDWFFRQRIIENEAPLERLVDPSYAEEAEKAFGKFTPINQDSKLAGCR